MIYAFTSCSDGMPFANPFTNHPSPVPSVLPAPAPFSPAPVAVPTPQDNGQEVGLSPLPSTDLSGLDPTDEADDNEDEDDREEDDTETDVLPTATPSSPTATRAVCVDAAFLEERKIERAHLVHHEHIHSDVLCPVNSTLPCATPEHAVTVNGTLMSYRQFCSQRGTECTSTRLFVNSVLVGHWTLEPHQHRSQTTVHLTMYDYRYPRVLQHVLHGFISMQRTLTSRG